MGGATELLVSYQYDCFNESYAVVQSMQWSEGPIRGRAATISRADAQRRVVRRTDALILCGAAADNGRKREGASSVLAASARGVQRGVPWCALGPDAAQKFLWTLGKSFG